VSEGDLENQFPAPFLCLKVKRKRRQKTSVYRLFAVKWTWEEMDSHEVYYNI